MSHDLRAPLNSLTGQTNLLKEETNPEIRNQLKKFQEESIAKLDKFILDILQISKVQRQEKVIDTFELPELIHSTVETLQFSNIGYEIEKHKGPKLLKFDRNRLKIILNNLISNAFFYSKSTDDSLIELKSVIDSNRLTISVWDNGIGISEKDINKVFDLFYRGNTQREGTGIGLSMLKETVEKSGGRISVSSKEGEFTCFTVDFPL